MILTIFICTFLTNPYQLLALDVNKLSQRISNDYTNKFCNGIGFGLSQDSAMNFAIKENNQAFSNKKGIEQIDKNSLYTDVAIKVVQKCGAPLGLSGENGIQEFQQYFINSITMKPN